MRASFWPTLLPVALLIFITAPALGRERVKTKTTATSVKRERVTVSFAADEGFEEAERARAEFLRKSRDRRAALKRAEASKQPKTLNVKVGTAPVSATVDEELNPKNKRREIGMAWSRRRIDSDLKEASIDGEIEDLNNEKFEITPEEKRELAELMRIPSSVEAPVEKPLEIEPEEKWLAVSPLSKSKYSSH